MFNLKYFFLSKSYDITARLEHRTVSSKLSKLTKNCLDLKYIFII